MPNTEPLSRTIRLHVFPEYLRWMFSFGDEIVQEFWKTRRDWRNCDCLRSVSLVAGSRLPTCLYWRTYGLGTAANFTFFMEQHPDKDVTITVQFPAPARYFEELKENQAVVDPVIETFNQCKDTLANCMQNAVKTVWQAYLEKLPFTCYYETIHRQWPDLTRTINESKLRMPESCNSAVYCEHFPSLQDVVPASARSKFLSGNNSVEFIYQFTKDKPGFLCESLNAAFSTSSFVLMTDNQSIYSSRPEIADFSARLEKLRQSFNQDIVREIVRWKTLSDTDVSTTVTD